jgi:hypothetical protein
MIADRQVKTGFDLELRMRILQHAGLGELPSVSMHKYRKLDSGDLR